MDEFTWAKREEVWPLTQYHNLFSANQNLEEALKARIDLKRKAYEYSRNNMITNRVAQANYLYSCAAFRRFSPNFEAFLSRTDVDYHVFDDLYQYMIDNNAPPTLIEQFNDVFVYKADNKDFFEWSEVRNGMLMPDPWAPAKVERAIPQTLTKVSGDGKQGPASTQLAAPFVVSVLDQDDAPLAGVAVTFSVTAGGGLLSSTSDANSCTIGSSTSSTTVTTDANGQAATRLTLGSEPGTNTVSATVEGLESVTFTATATEQAMPHSLTKVCGDSQEGTAIVLLDEPLVVLVSDEEGAAMAGVVVSFAVTAGGGTLSDTTATTDANGRAATRLTLGIEAGTNTVAATVEGVEPVTFTATAQESPFASLFDLFQSGKRVALPDRPQLAQNVPNPFNSQTVLSYFLHAPGPARLEVFSLTGQRVAVLRRGPEQAGYHRLHWDGRDDVGRSVASGLYLYRLVTDEAVLTRKLLLLR